MLAHRAALALIPHMHKSAQTYAAIFGNPYQHKKMEKQLLFWLVSGTVLNFAVPRSLFISCLYVRIYRPTEIYTCMHLRVCTVYTRTCKYIIYIAVQYSWYLYSESNDLVSIFNNFIDLSIALSI